MPGDAPVNKQVRCRSYGARVVLSDVVENENREVTAARLAESLSREHGFTLLHPFEDHDVIAGQGTVAVELAEQATADLGVTHVDAFFVCAGGGGLAAGCCLALEESMPECKRYAVEPEAYDDHARSFAAGERLSVTGNPYSICDALQAASPGANTFPITSRLLTGVLTVSDDEVRHAMRVAFECLQLVLEPSGAVPLAAVLARKVSKRAKLCVLSVFFFLSFFWTRLSKWSVKSMLLTPTSNHTAQLSLPIYRHLSAIHHNHNILHCWHHHPPSTFHHHDSYLHAPAALPRSYRFNHTRVTQVSPTFRNNHQNR
jgi:cysteine synthase